MTQNYQCTDEKSKNQQMARNTGTDGQIDMRIPKYLQNIFWDARGYNDVQEQKNSLVKSYLMAPSQNQCQLVQQAHMQ